MDKWSEPADKLKDSMRQKALQLFIVFALILLPGAQSLSAVEELNAFRFMSDYVDSLGAARAGMAPSADQILKPVSDESEGDESKSDAYSINRGLEEAKGYLSEYAEIDNRTLRTVIAGTLMSYQRQMVANLQGIDLIEQLSAVDGEETFDQGVYMRIRQGIQDEKVKALRLLTSSAVLASHLLIHSEPDEEGNMTILSVTASEKQLLIDKLIEHFGVELQSEDQSNLSPVAAPAAAIYQVLIEEGRIPLNVFLGIEEPPAEVNEEEVASDGEA